MRLKDRVAIVTGAARGMGRGFALRLAEEGAKILARLDELILEDERHQAQLVTASAEDLTAEIRRDHLMQVFMAWPRMLGLPPMFDRDWLSDDRAGLLQIRFDLRRDVERVLLPHSVDLNEDRRLAVEARRLIGVFEAVDDGRHLAAEGWHRRQGEGGQQPNLKFVVSHGIPPIIGSMAICQDSLSV